MRSKLRSGRLFSVLPVRARDDHRAGLTLLEVILSLTIFLASMVVLSQLISTGVRAAVQARWQTQAILRCESKFDELIAGAEPLQDTTEGSFIDDELDVWRWSLQIAPGPEDYLNELTLTVWRIGEGDNALTTTSYTLIRYYFDRQAVAEELALQSEETVE